MGKEETSLQLLLISESPCFHKAVCRSTAELSPANSIHSPVMAPRLPKQGKGRARMGCTAATTLSRELPTDQHVPACNYTKRNSEDKGQCNPPQPRDGGWRSVCSCRTALSVLMNRGVSALSIKEVTQTGSSLLKCSWQRTSPRCSPS